MKKIKILHIINNLGVGGAERVLLLLLEELSKREDLAITLVSLEGHGDLENEFKKLPIKFKKFHYHLFVPYISRLDPFFRLRLWLFALKERPDIIHGHLMKGEDFAKVLGGVLQKPVVTTSHDCFIYPGRKQKYLNKFLTKAAAVSDVVREHLLKYYDIPSAKVTVIPNAVKLQEYKSSVKSFDLKTPVFLYVGRLIKEKGVQHAIEGLAPLVREYPGMKLNIFGGGPYESTLHRLVEKRGYTFVNFMGVTHDVPTAFSTGDIFIMPSQSEGFSMATLEAIASGKAIIATKTGAVSSMLRDGENGYFIKYSDLAGISKAAKRILAGDIGKMQKISLDIAKEQFNMEKVSKLYYNLYLSMSKSNV